MGGLITAPEQAMALESSGKEKVSMEDFVVLSILGSGGFGKVIGST